jgi:hypothetical protein
MNPRLLGRGCRDRERAWSGETPTIDPEIGLETEPRGSSSVPSPSWHIRVAVRANIGGVRTPDAHGSELLVETNRLGFSSR